MLNAIQFSQIQSNSVKFHQIPLNSIKFCQIPLNSVQFCQIPLNSVQFRSTHLTELQNESLARLARVLPIDLSVLGENAISLEEVAVRPSEGREAAWCDIISGLQRKHGRTCEKLTETRPRRNGNNTVEGQAIFGF